MIGNVRGWNSTGGYGFVEPEDCENSLFFQAKDVNV